MIAYAKDKTIETAMRVTAQPINPPPIRPPTDIVIRLTIDEAVLLLTLVGGVVGPSENPIRKFSKDLYNSLQETGEMPGVHERITIRDNLLDIFIG